MLKNECQNTKKIITYRQVGDYLIPNLTVPPEEKRTPLGRWGTAHREYLLKNKRVLFNLLLTRGELFQYLAETDRQAEELFSRLVNDMVRSEGIDEKLKEENQML